MRVARDPDHARHFGFHRSVDPIHRARVRPGISGIVGRRARIVGCIQLVKEAVRLMRVGVLVPVEDQVAHLRAHGIAQVAPERLLDVGNLRRLLMRELVSARQPLGLQGLRGEARRHRRIGRCAFRLHGRRRAAGEKRPLGHPRRNAVDAHPERPENVHPEEPLQNRPLRRPPARSPVSVNARDSRRGAGAARSSGVSSMRHGIRMPPDWPTVATFIAAFSSAAGPVSPTPPRGPCEVVTNVDSREKRPDFGRLAVAVAELALRLPLLLAFGDDRGPVLRLRVAVLRGEPIGFGPDFIGEGFAFEPGDLVQPLPDFGQPNRQFLSGSHFSFLAVR